MVPSYRHISAHTKWLMKRAKSSINTHSCWLEPGFPSPGILWYNTWHPLGGGDDYWMCSLLTACYIILGLPLRTFFELFAFMPPSVSIFFSPSNKLNSPSWRLPSRWMTWLLPPDLKLAYSITYVINWFWKPTCISYDPTLILPCTHS